MTRGSSDLIILKRTRFGRPVILGVEHKVVRHSPTGMEWGYGGSGPSDLALNVLLQVGLEPKEADALYQQFKFGFISCMPKEGGVIEPARVLEWAEKMRAHLDQLAAKEAS